MKSPISKWYYKILIKGLLWFYLFIILGILAFVFLCLNVQVNGHELLHELWM